MTGKRGHKGSQAWLGHQQIVQGVRAVAPRVVRGAAGVGRAESEAQGRCEQGWKVDALAHGG